MPAKSSRDTPKSVSNASPEPLVAVTAAHLLARYEVVPIASLKPHPENYRTHPDDEQQHIRASLQVHDQYKNVVTADDLTLLAGHGVIEAMRSLGRTQVVIQRMPYAPDDPRALQILVGDNEIARLAHQHDHELTALLARLQDDLGDAMLLGTGFDPLMLAALAGTGGLDATTPGFVPTSEDGQGRLDQQQPITCPACGHEWVP